MSGTNRFLDIKKMAKGCKEMIRNTWFEVLWSVLKACEASAETDEEKAMMHSIKRMLIDKIMPKEE